MKLTTKNIAPLERLCGSEDGSGVGAEWFTVPERRILGRMITAGWVERLDGAGMTVYFVTESGRAAIESAREGDI